MYLTELFDYHEKPLDKPKLDTLVQKILVHCSDTIKQYKKMRRLLYTGIHGTSRTSFFFEITFQ